MSSTGIEPILVFTTNSFTENHLYHSEHLPLEAYLLFNCCPLLLIFLQEYSFSFFSKLSLKQAQASLLTSLANSQDTILYRYLYPALC